jgi:hypothetical protein
MMKKTVLVLTLLALASPLAAQTAEETNAQLLRTLLEEIRTLRITMQKTAGHQLRAQVLIERMKLQQQTVRELQQQTDQWNLDRSSMMEREPFDEMIRDIEERLRTESDPEQKKQLERELDAHKRRKEMEGRHREQMQLRFQRMETRLADENARLRAIEEDLARLEAEMSKPLPEKP